jgi:hypothetical protein
MKKLTKKQAKELAALARTPTVISNGAGRRIFFPFCSCKMVGLRSEKSLFVFGA